MKSTHTMLRFGFLLCLMIWVAKEVFSQPYVDLVQVRYTYGFRNSSAVATPFNHLWIGSDLPIELKESTYLLLSPTFEQWQIDSADKQEIFPVIRGFAFPVGLIFPIHNSSWSFTFLAIPRSNGEKLFAENTFQIGGAALASVLNKPKQKFRLGVYANQEFFGLYVIPLLGVDWRINEKNNLFGNLPGRLTYEHQLNTKWYSGLTFRSITNSFRLSNGQYLRLQDTQASLYLDYYLSKSICLTLEPGYGFSRKIRTGINKKEYLTEVKWGDGLFVKLNAAYRLRIE